jgi:hypothetical protein
MSWIEELDSEELAQEITAEDAKHIASHVLTHKLSPELLASPEVLEKGLGPVGDERKSLLKAIAAEIRVLVCTEDTKYSELRSQLNKWAGKGSAFVVSLISAALAASLGVAAAALIASLVAIVLLAVTQVGRNAYCAAA